MKNVFPPQVRILFALVFLLWAGTITAQPLNGAYTINSGQPTAGTNYQTFGAAVTALQTQGISGPVVIDVVANSGPYLEHVELGPVVGTSVTNTITVVGNNNNLEFATSANISSNKVLWLKGVDHLTIDGLNVKVSSPKTDGYAVWLSDQTDYLSIRNCSIIGASFNNSALYVPASTTSMESASYLTVEYNTILRGSNAVEINGRSLGNGIPGVVVADNVVSEFGFRGLLLSNLQGAEVIRNNVVQVDVGQSVEQNFGITLSGKMTNTIVSQNEISSPNHTPSSSRLSTSRGNGFGIYCFNMTAPIGSEVLISNNLIHDLTYYVVAGINHYNSTGVHYYNNTVIVEEAYQRLTSNTFGFSCHVSGADQIAFKNNLISINRGNKSNNTGVSLNGSLGSGAVLDFSNNNYYVNGHEDFGVTRVGVYFDIACPTLADWQAQNGGLNDPNSLSVYPRMKNSFYPQAPQLDQAGAALGLLEDHFGQSRSTQPDIGAVEHIQPTNDIGITHIGPEVVCGTMSTIEAELTNFGVASLTSAMISYQFNGGAVQSINYTGNLAPGSSMTISLGAASVGAGITVKAWTSFPNGVSDEDALNDELTQSKSLGMSGNYTINGYLSTNGTNFHSFQDASDALNERGVCGPVVFIVTPSVDPNVSIYTGNMQLRDVKGTSSTNTITFNGQGAKLSISYNNTTDHSMLINGAKHVTIRNLKIENHDPFGASISIVGTSEFVTVEDCEIYVAFPGPSSNLTTIAGVAMSGLLEGSPELGVSPTNITVKNCSIRGAYQGIRLLGGWDQAGTPGNKFHIVGNEITEFKSHGIEMHNVDSCILDSNTIRTYQHTNRSTPYGIGVIGQSRFNTISRNYIGAEGSFTIPNFSGIVLEADQNQLLIPWNKIQNNIIRLNGNGNVTGILVNDGSGYEVAHNSIVMEQTGHTNTGITGLQVANGVTGLDFRNNLIYLNKQGTGTSAINGLVISDQSSNVLTDRNLIYLSGPSTASVNYGTWGSAFSSFASWQTANSGAFDQNSVNVDPIFSNLTTNDFTPNNGFGGNIGAPLGVTEDYFGASRSSTTPDPGAIEFLGSTNTDVGVFNILDPGTAICASNNQPIQIVLRNYGLAPQTNFNFSVTLTGALPASFNQLYTDTLGPGEYDTVLVGTINTILTNPFTVQATTSLAGDQQPGNDQFTQTTNVNAFVNLGNDTALCAGSSIVLTAGGQGNTYQWNTFHTSLAITVTNPGTYRVTKTHTASGCVFSDTIVIVNDTNCLGPVAIAPVFCGSTLSSMNTYISYSTVPGATNYRYRVTASGFSAVGVRGYAASNFRLDQVPGVGYNTTYSVQVAAYINGAWSNYGPTCQITTPANAPTTQLLTNSCNITLANLNQWLYITSVPSATNYRYRVTASGFSQVYERGFAWTNFRLGFVPGIVYNTTYSVEVAAEIGGVWGPYGSVCTLTTPSNVPVTQVVTSQCNTTLSSWTQYLFYQQVPGATNYRVELTNSGVGFSTVYYRGIGSTTFRIDWMSGSLQSNTTYTLRVASFVGGTWSSYGPSCTLTTPGTPQPRLHVVDLANGEDQDPGELTSLSVYPNPSTGNLWLQGQWETDSPLQISLLDVTGKLVWQEQRTVIAPQQTLEIAPGSLSAGVYFLQVATPSATQTVKVIREQ